MLDLVELRFKPIEVILFVLQYRFQHLSRYIIAEFRCLSDTFVVSLYRSLFRLQIVFKLILN